MNELISRMMTISKWYESSDSSTAAPLMLQVGGADNGVFSVFNGLSKFFKGPKTKGNLSAEIAAIRCFIKFEYSSDETVSMKSLWGINQCPL